jgi:DNA-directed RNA polymerase subunit omega
MNPELAKQALLKVGNPNVLVNLVSRRVRQLNAGGGGMGRPLISDTGNLGLGDIALLEIIHDKVGFEMPELASPTDQKPKRKRRSSSS